MTFRSKQQQALMHTRSRLEAAMREATGGKGLTMLQLTCMHDLGITALSNWSLQDKELLTETPQWKALLKVEIQSNKNQLDALVKKQTWQCEKQAKRKEAREYPGNKKGPSKFCGNTHSIQAPKELVLDMPIGVMWINRQPTAESQEIVKRICDEVPSVQMYKTEGEVAILVLTIPEEQTSEGAALVRNVQQTWKWRSALRKPQHLAEVLRGLCLQKRQGNPDKVVLRQLSLELVNILTKLCFCKNNKRSIIIMGRARGPPTCNDLNISATRGHQDMRFCVCGSPRGDLSHIAGLTIGRSRSDFSGDNWRSQEPYMWGVGLTQQID